MIGSDASCAAVPEINKGGDPKSELKDLLMKLLDLLGGDEAEEGSDVTAAGAELEPGDTETPEGSPAEPLAGDTGTNPSPSGGPAGAMPPGGPAGAGGPPPELKAKLMALLAAKQKGAPAPMM